MDNPDREQGQWIDNTRPNALAGYYWFGETVKPAKALRDFLLNQADDGQFSGYAPGRWFPWIPLQCRMSLYALACHEYFQVTGDTATGADLLAGLLRAIEHSPRRPPTVRPVRGCSRERS